MPTEKEYSCTIKDFNTHVESILSSTSDSEGRTYLIMFKNFIEIKLKRSSHLLTDCFSLFLKNIIHPFL